MLFILFTQTAIILIYYNIMYKSKNIMNACKMFIHRQYNVRNRKIGKIMKYESTRISIFFWYL